MSEATLLAMLSSHTLSRSRMVQLPRYLPVTIQNITSEWLELGEKSSSASYEYTDEGLLITVDILYTVSITTNRGFDLTSLLEPISVAKSNMLLLIGSDDNIIRILESTGLSKRYNVDLNTLSIRFKDRQESTTLIWFTEIAFHIGATFLITQIGLGYEPESGIEYYRTKYHALCSNNLGSLKDLIAWAEQLRLINASSLSKPQLCEAIRSYYNFD